MKDKPLKTMNAMVNLFWKTKTETKSLLSTPFKSEEDFERLVFNTPEILEDIFLIKRQIRGGNKGGIPDIVGIDNDGNICIVEMKNVTVNALIIPQVLQYAFWAETNPDSIKSLWLETDNKPDDLVISWENFKVRIIVIAPKILSSTLDIVEKINYQVDLIEVNQWIEGEHQLLLVKKLDRDTPRIASKPASGMESYDEEYYKREFNKESGMQFVRYIKEVEAIIKDRNWTLETKFNKHYCGFKAGFFNAFGIKWIGTKSFAFFFKLPEAEAVISGIKMLRYESMWKEAIYYIEPGVTKTKDFMMLFERAYHKLTGD